MTFASAAALLILGSAAADAGAACKKPKYWIVEKSNGPITVYSGPAKDDWGDDFMGCIAGGRMRYLGNESYTDAGFDDIARVRIKGHSVIVTKSTYNMDETNNPYVDKYRVDLRTGKRYKISHKRNSCVGHCEWEGQKFVNGKWIVVDDA